ncbi:MAG: hypothetical protein RL490_1807 [Pseudomonadota bacterium]
MRRIVLLALLLPLLLLLYGLAEAVQDPQLVRYRVAVPGLDRPLRIVQLSDTHASPIDMPTVRLDRVMARVNALHPDLIVLTGDYIGGKLFDVPMDLSTAIDPFHRLRAPLGVYAVRGNHDGKYWTRWGFARGEAVMLSNHWADVGPVILAGAPSLAEGRNPAGAMIDAVQAAPRGKPLILIAHEPDFFIYVPPRVAVMIAGHTHGGQIRLPFLDGLAASPYLSAHRRGVFREHGQTLVVSSGLGTSLLPLRIGVPPEIVEITLVPAG